MADEKSDKLQEPKQTLTDNQITTERSLGRRSFLTAVGAIVAGGAAALALGDRLDAAVAGQQKSDPDQKKERSDPDQKKKRSDPDQKKKRKGHRSDPDQKKKGTRSDPDQKKTTPSDPDH